MSSKIRWNLALALAVVASLAFGAPAHAEGAADAADAPAPEMQVSTPAPVSAAAGGPLLPALPGTEPLNLAPGVERCGYRVCPPHLECCNASCGICVEPGGVCIQIVCEGPPFGPPSPPTVPPSD